MLNYTCTRTQLVKFKAITSVWKVHFKQFEHFSVANSDLFQMVCSTQKIVSAQNSRIMDINPWYECEKWLNLSRKKYLS